MYPTTTEPPRVSSLVRCSVHRGKVGFVLDLSSDIPAHQWWIEQIRWGWEQGVFDFLDETMREGDSFLDIGASIGPYAVFAAMKVGVRGHVIAVEPDPVALAFLRHNLQLNGCNQVVVLAAALSDHDEPIGIKKSNVWGDSSTRVAFPDEIPDHIVPGFTFKSIYRHLNFIPTFTKIDIEGGERLLLDPDTLSMALSTEALILEVHAHALGDAAARLTQLLRTACLKTNMDVREIDRRTEDNYHLVAHRRTGRA